MESWYLLLEIKFCFVVSRWDAINTFTIDFKNILICLIEFKLRHMHVFITFLSSICCFECSELKSLKKKIKFVYYQIRASINNVCKILLPKLKINTCDTSNDCKFKEICCKKDIFNN